MSKIRFNIAGGHMRGEIRKLIEDNPQRTPQENVAVWVETRFGGWVRKHMAEASPWLFESVVVEGTGDEMTGVFHIDFENPNDEDFFVRHVGGKVVPSENT